MGTYWVNVRGYTLRVAARSQAQALQSARAYAAVNDDVLARMARDDAQISDRTLRLARALERRSQFRVVG